MKTTFRSCFVLTGLIAIWPQGFFGSQAFIAAGFCQAINASDPTRIGVYPAIFSSPQIPTEVEPQLKADPAFVRWSEEISARLVIALLEEDLEEVLPPGKFAGFLQSRPAFDPFHPDSVRKLCAAFALQKLVVPVISAAAETPAEKPSPPLLRIHLILRWLDGVSGEVTKFHAGDYQVSRSSEHTDVIADDFDARAATQALLAAPELIISQEEEPVPLPLPLALPEPAMTSPKSRKWWWYVSAAAVIGGGSAYLFLGRGDSEENPRLLPEPPGPPPQ